MQHPKSPLTVTPKSQSPKESKESMVTKYVASLIWIFHTQKDSVCVIKTGGLTKIHIYIQPHVLTFKSRTLLLSKWALGTRCEEPSLTEYHYFLLFGCLFLMKALSLFKPHFPETLWIFNTETDCLIKWAVPDAHNCWTRRGDNYWKPQESHPVKKEKRKKIKSGKVTKTALCKMSTIRLGGFYSLANESISGYAV